MNRIKLFFVLCCSVLFAVEKIDYLFCLQGAGETLAFLPVIERLERQGHSVSLLTGGVASVCAEVLEESLR